MKKSICILIVLVILSLSLTSCGLTVPRPEVKEGEFDVSITYEVNGEVKTLDLVYVCEYNGIALTLEGTYCRDWNGNFVGYDDGDVIPVLETAGGKVALCVLIYPEYFMGEPDYIDDFSPVVLTNYIYYEDGNEMIIDDQELIAEKYGVKVIGCAYSEPIENSFN
jgi:hypothetical protein